MPEFYRLSIPETLSELHVEPKDGLASPEVLKRQAQYGKNTLPAAKGPTVLQLIISQFSNIMVIVLVIAAIISAFLGDVEDVVVILIIVVLNAVLGAFQEYRAEQALAALSKMQVPRVRVRREDNVQLISAEDLVPGDIVLLQEGDQVPADGRLILVSNLQVSEAALTGESMAVEKTMDPIIEENVGIGDRKNMVFMGTAVTYGRGEMAVTATGLKTQLGNIASLLMGVEEGKTPLQKQLDRLGVLLVRGALVVVGIVFLAGVLRGIPIQEMFITAISLAVAAVPEGLPAIITIGLSLGAARMVRRNALIRRLPAVETLGSVTIICSDKTGTLTKNEMTATVLALPGHDDVEVTGVGYTPSGDFMSGGQRLDPKTNPAIGRFLKAMALSTDAYVQQTDDSGQYTIVGDTTEGALLVAAQKVGWTRAEIEQDMPRVAELPFSSERKAMTTVHDVRSQETRNLFGGAVVVAITKGAPDRLIEWATNEHTPEGSRPLNDERRRKWYDQVNKMAAQGLRVLGVGYRPLGGVPEHVTEETERELHLLGLIGILDPARPEARASVQTARGAGIRPVMITGDHALTAETIGRDLGIIKEGEKAIAGVELEKMGDSQMAEALTKTSVFARVSPEHKLRLVRVLQGQQQVVAMTGDGVNDAPALKQADIGVAMGITGTEVSKGAADMVLTDDNFSSIVAAVEEGRVIYDNIRKFVRYLLGSNIGEILVMFLGILAGWQVPLLATQILWINLVTDGLPAVALGFERAEQDVMKRRPRPMNESVFAHGLWQKMVFVSIVLTIVTLIAFVYGHLAYGMEPSSPTLGLEKLSRQQLIAFIPEEFVPQDWDNLAVEERIKRVLVRERSEKAEGELLAHAERIPRTLAFIVLALGQIFHVMAIRAGDATSFFRVWFRGNPILFWACVSTIVLQLLVVYLPFMHNVFETYSPQLAELAFTLGLASLVLFATEIDKLIRAMRERPALAAV